jgi:hypothetical protein
MKNAYEIRGDITAIFLNSPKYGLMETLIDTEDLGKAIAFPNTWGARWDKKTKSFYCRGSEFINGKQKTIYLHRWLTECPKHMHVDHYDNNSLNNQRKANLRILTCAENQQNRKGATRHNKSSGIRGVKLDKRTNKWIARIGLNGKRKHIGCFVSVIEAEKAVMEARSELMPYSK